jgi:hypothetical protein
MTDPMPVVDGGGGGAASAAARRGGAAFLVGAAFFGAGDFLADGFFDAKAILPAVDLADAHPRPSAPAA